MKVPWKKLDFTPEYAEWVRSGRKTATTRLETDLRAGDIGWDVENKVAVAITGIEVKEYCEADTYHKEGYTCLNDQRREIIRLYGVHDWGTEYEFIDFICLPGVDLTPADDNDGWIPVGAPEANALKGQRVLFSDGDDNVYFGTFTRSDRPGRAVHPLPPPYKPPVVDDPWDVDVAQAEIAMLIATDIHEYGDASNCTKIHAWMHYTATRKMWMEYCDSIDWTEGKRIKGYKVES